MKKLILTAFVAALMAVSVQAQDKTPDERKAARAEKIKEKLDKMTPEQKAKFQEKMADRKAKWEAMSPADRQAAKEKMKEEREKFKAMTPEERKAAREKAKGKIGG